MIGRICAGVLRRIHERVSTPTTAFARCGKNVDIFAPFHCSHPGEVTVGDHVHIGHETWWYTEGGLEVGSGTVFGPHVTIHTSNHRYEEAEAVPYDGTMILRKVTIGANVWIGANVVIVPGVSIGEGAVVGAGAVVVKNVPDLAIVGGNPAKVIKYRDEQRYRRLAAEGKQYLDLKARGLIERSRVRRES